MECVCGVELTGRQKKYCSTYCQNRDRSFDGHRYRPKRVFNNRRARNLTAAPGDNYGQFKVDDEEMSSADPIREFWSEVVLRAKEDVTLHRKGWQDSLNFIKRSRDSMFDDICGMLDINPARASKNILKELGAI